MKVRFGDFVLDRGGRQLRRGEAAVHLEPKTFELLDFLVRSRPKALTKRTSGTGCGRNRRGRGEPHGGGGRAPMQALGDDARGPRFVRTVYAFGYAFAGEAEERPGRLDPASPA